MSKCFGELGAPDSLTSPVAFADIQTIATDKILGRDTAGTGVIEELSIGSGLTLSGGTLDAHGYSGFYHPDIPPVTCAKDEEFTNGAEALSWSWGNQGSSTIEFYADCAILSVAASTPNRRIRYLAPPSGSWMLAAKVSINGLGNLGLLGVGILETGTEAAPTFMSMVTMQTGTSASYAAYSVTSLTSAYTGLAGGLANIHGGAGPGRWAYFRIIYDDSTKSTTYAASENGIVFTVLATRTVTAALSLFWLVDSSSFGAGADVVGICDFFRVFTDATHNAAPYLIGEP